jgi:4-amino-4-deoxy-L-arabinose transferase-like glycosyltransferase
MSDRKALLAALAPMLAVVACRFAAPSDLDDNDQAIQALYVLDIWENGNWILPNASGVMAATKPPLYTWLASLASVFSGGPTPFTVALPSALCVLALAIVVFRVAAERWSMPIGIASAWILATSHTLVTLSVHVRPDALLALLVALALFAVHRVDAGRARGMASLFWIATGLSGLVKGPVGPLLTVGAAGVLAILPRWRPAVAAVLRSGAMWWLALPAAWLLLAYLVGGNSYLKGIVLPHTVDRALGQGQFSGRGHWPGYLILQFLAKAAPWSIFAIAGTVFAVARRKEPDAWGHLALPAAWFAPALLVLSLPAGQREDYLMPVLAGASILAAVMLLQPPRPQIATLWSATAWVAGIAALGVGIAAIAGVSWMGRSTGTAWGIALMVAGVALLVSRLVRQTDFARLLVAISGVLVAYIVYTFTIAPVARLRWGVDTVAFARDIGRHRKPGDELEFHPLTFNALRFHLGLNRNSLLADDAKYLPSRVQAGRRVLVATTLATLKDMGDVSYRILAERPIAYLPNDRLLLLEVMPP